MQISSVQGLSASSIQNQQSQLYSQIQGLKNKDAKANSAQIQQLQQKLNKLLQQKVQPAAQAQPQIQVQVQSVGSKEPTKQPQAHEQTNITSPNTSTDVPIGKNVDAKA